MRGRERNGQSGLRWQFCNAAYELESISNTSYRCTMCWRDVVNSPTRETDHSATLIDHVYTSDTRLVNSCTILPPLDSSDHYSIQTTLYLSPPPSLRPLRRNVWLYSRAKFEAINSDLEPINSDLEPAISSLDPQVDVNLAWNQFHNTFLSVLLNHIPNEILTTRKSLPWITYNLRFLLQKRDQAYVQKSKENS